MGLSEQLESTIVSRIEKDNLTLPSLPTTAIKAVELLRSPDFDNQEVSRLVETDPVLAAQLLKSCNSAALTTREPCTTINEAIVRLGAQKLRTLLIEASTRKVFESRDPRISIAAKAVWEHSRAVAHLSQRIALVTGAADPDLAYLAGLLHDVGKPVTAVILLEMESIILQRNPRLWIDSATWIDVIQRTHRAIGLKLALKWQLPDDVRMAMEAFHDYDPAVRLSPGNAVRFANAVVKQLGIYVGPVDATENDTLVIIGRSLLGVEESTLARLCADLRDKAKERA